MNLFKNLDNKKKAYFTLIILGLISLAFWYYSDAFALWSSMANPWVAMIANILLNPAYLFLIIWLWDAYQIRGFLSGILISLGVDIISLAHSVHTQGIMPVDTALYSYADTTFYKLIYLYIQGPTAVFIIYVILPVALFYLALRIIRRTASFNKIVKEAI